MLLVMPLNVYVMLFTCIHGLTKSRFFAQHVASVLQRQKCAESVPSVQTKKMHVLLEEYVHCTGGATQSRTGLNGFAIRCITALLSRHDFDEKGKHGVLPLSNLERETRLELATSTLARLRSTN